MKATPDLHHLVHSLSRNEKRYISLHAMRDNNYLKLFDAINSQKEFNEEQLRRSMKGEIRLQSLHFIKNQLYSVIIKKLSSFYWGRNKNTELDEAFIELNILFDKNFSAMATKKLNKIIQYGEENEDFILLIKCCSWEKKLHANSNLKNANTKGITKFLEKELYYSKCLDNLNIYSALANKGQIWANNNGKVRNKKDEEEILTILKHPLLRHEKKALSKKAISFYHHIRGGCFFLLQKYPEALKSYEFIVSFLEPIIHNNETNMRSYVSSLYNVAMLNIHKKNYGAALFALQKIKNISKGNKSSKNLENQISIQSYTGELMLYLESADHEKALELIPVIERSLKKSNIGLEHIISTPLYYCFALVHFIYCNYSKTLFYLNKIINNNVSFKYREDVQCFSRILFLLTHYEMKSDGIPDYFVESTYSFLIKRKRLYHLENVFLTFIKNKLFLNMEKNLLQKELTTMKQKIEQIQKKPYNKDVVDYFDFASWVESKISGKSFMSVLKQKEMNLSQ